MPENATGINNIAGTAINNGNHNGGPGIFGPTDHRVFTTEGDVACRGVDLNRLKHTGIQEAPEHGVTENGTATGCPDKFTTSDGHGSNDNAGAGKGRERSQTNCS